MLSALVQQVLTLTLAGLILDGGVIAQTCFFAFVAFWGGGVVILFRRRLSPTKLDLMLVRVGYWPVCVMTYFLTQAIWCWRGV